MAVPKRRHSKTRRNKRRTHHKMKRPSLSHCPECHEAKLPHRVCENCGYYKGRKVIDTDEF